MNSTETPPDNLDPQNAVERLFSILSPNLEAEAKKLESGDYQLVHYTSAENAMNILKSEKFWLRNVRCMNDYSEVQHGINLILKVFNENDELRIKRLVGILDQVHEGAARDAIIRFNNWIPALPDDTFIGCMSIYDANDDYGRLSMWRAYSSAGAGVALVMNNQPFLAETDRLKAYSIPVAYLSDIQLTEGIDRCLDALEANLDAVKFAEYDAIEATVFWWLVCLAVGLKHPAFVEEREWRVLYMPSMDRSPVIEPSVESVSGIPQLVQKIPLRNDPENGLHGADIPNLIDKVLIGPSQYPMVLRDAFLAILDEKGVDDPASKIAISFIPLR